MINQVKVFLKQNNYNTQNNDFENYFLSHPNYPSLFAITDTLNLLNVENVAARVSKEQFEELPNNFLAIISNNNSNEELVFVERITNNISITGSNNKIEKISNTDFLNRWNGIIIAIEPNDKIEIQKRKKSSLISIVLLITTLFFANNFFEKTLNITSIIGFFISILGLIISIFILQEKNNNGNEVVSKLCNFNENTSCDSVIKSKNTTFFKAIDFSDLPIIFFSSSTISLIYNGSSVFVISLISVFSIPIIIYSIWLQKIKLKKWCILCLLVSTLLICLSGLALFNKDNSIFYNVFVLTIILVSLTWYFIKKINEKKSSLSNENNELLKFKRNPSLFNMLQKELKNINLFHQISKIELGNPNAKINLTIIVSPSCGHCHKAYSDGIKLINKYKEQLSLSIFFNVNPNNNDNPYLQIVKNLLQINKENPSQVINAMNDWHIKNLNLNEWLLEWEQLEIDAEIEQEIQNQYDWCFANDFNYTPIKIINEKEFPKEYDLHEIKYFITELEEQQELTLV